MEGTMSLMLKAVLICNRAAVICAAFGALLCAFGAAEENKAQEPEIVVAANKEPAPANSLPLSVSVVSSAVISDAGIRVVKDAAVYAPNVFMGDFGPRRLSNPYFRGIGAGPNNPGVLTSVDGVPQPGASTASMELLDVEQVEFARGAQGALFGRNSIGGVIHVNSRRPSPEWKFESELIGGNFDYNAVTFGISGPVIADQWGMSLAGGHSERDGYTENRLTGDDVDFRDAWFCKGQFALLDGEQWDARLIVSWESDDDGDYALGDLAALRAMPHRVEHDYEGSTERDVLQSTLLLAYEGESVLIRSISGGIWSEIEDNTDLDYSAWPLLISRDEEDQLQVSQEIQFASRKDRTLKLTDGITMGWQAGVFFFSQEFEKNRVMDLLPGLTMLPYAVQEAAAADTRTIGAGVYGQGKFTVLDKFGITAGLRFDSERAEADLVSASAFAPAASQELDRDFSEVSPRLGLDCKVGGAGLVYASAGRGYKAGGFNAVAPSDNESYGEERSWNYEVGAKAEALDGRLRLQAACFLLTWDDMQMYVPNPVIPGNYFVDNAGEAESRGLELEVQWKAAAGVDLFGSFGWTDAEFSGGAESQGIAPEGNTLPFTPEFTANAGLQYSLEISSDLVCFVRAEVTLCGDYYYDAFNVQGQDAFKLVDLRLGLKGGQWLVEGWIKNAFEEEYIPVAFAYSMAQSGYIGDSGAPATFGLRAGLTF
jgi:iron complex outermembrane recepter protein